jgi:mannosyltransferase
VTAATQPRGSGAPALPEVAGPYLGWLLVVVALGAALRFATLDVQSFWLDEAVTVDLLRRSFPDMLSQLPSQESAPPLYYVLAWPWTRVFGFGEVGVRSLSALIGTLTIPVVYAAGAVLWSRRVGLIAALLFAVNPLMFHYGQEARAYALLLLTGSLSLLFFALALRRPAGASLALWAACSALALASHYFAVFLVVPEAVWLLAVGRSRRAAALAVGGVGAASLALLPLAVTQASHRGSEWIGEVALGRWLAQVPKQFLVGIDGPAEPVTAAFSAALVAGGALLLVRRGDPAERSVAVLVTVLGVAAVAFPLVVSLVGPEIFTGRNVILAWVPAVLVAAAGYGARRAGRVGAACVVALAALWLAVIVVVVTEPRYQRDDWRGALDALGETRGARAIVLTPGNSAAQLEVYRPGARSANRPVTAIREIAVLALAHREPGRALETPPFPRQHAPAGFRVVERRREDTFALVRLRARRDVPLRLPALRRLAIGGGEPLLLLERG